MAKNELEAQCDLDPSISELLSEIAQNDEKDIVAEASALPVTDPRRLAVLDPRLVRQSISSKKGIHLKVSTQFEIVQNILMIQRCLGSDLPVKTGEPIPLRGLFKKLTRKTAVIERLPSEELEYQLFHRDAAK
jgi:hypothetical protein